MHWNQGIFYFFRTRTLTYIFFGFKIGTYAANIPAFKVVCKLAYFWPRPYLKALSPQTFIIRIILHAAHRFSPAWENRLFPLCVVIFPITQIYQMLPTNFKVCSCTFVMVSKVSTWWKEIIIYLPFDSSYVKGWETLNLD